MRARAVIGAAFGDEGKGLIVDYLCDRSSLVVRSNGGAQAGHTVVIPGRRARHVFHHFGSGSLRGAATYLSRYFVANPTLFCDEYGELTRLIDPPTVLLDRRSLLTTPYDVFINEEVERQRGTKRHGSCGLGINETVTRCEAPAVATFAGSLLVPDALEGRLTRIREQWVPVRLAQLRIAKPSEQFRRYVESREILDAYLGHCQGLVHRAELVDGMPARFDDVVFEGAQGLLLDEQHQFFPHVTRSRTGIPNVAAICRDAGIESVDVYYVLRPYMTRHGAGPFPTELPAVKVKDDTNVDWEFQGPLRVGRLDFPLIRQAIDGDVALAGNGDWTAALAVTHLDEVEDEAAVIAGIEARLGHPVELVSRGPTREDVADGASIQREAAT